MALVAILAAPPTRRRISLMTTRTMSTRNRRSARRKRKKSGRSSMATKKTQMMTMMMMMIAKILTRRNTGTSTQAPGISMADNAVIAMSAILSAHLATAVAENQATLERAEMMMSTVQAARPGVVATEAAPTDANLNTLEVAEMKTNTVVVARRRVAIPAALTAKKVLAVTGQAPTDVKRQVAMEEIPTVARRRPLATVAEIPPDASLAMAKPGTNVRPPALMVEVILTVVEVVVVTRMAAVVEVVAMVATMTTIPRAMVGALVVVEASKCPEVSEMTTTTMMRDSDVVVTTKLEK
jgi:hypothetical protein